MRVHFPLILVFVFAITKSSISQNSKTLAERPDPVWMTHYVAQGFIPSDLKVDLYGNVITAGTFEGHMTWKGGSRIPKRRPFPERSPNNYFILKHDPEGRVLWKNFADGDARISAILLDDSGCVYVTGEVFSRELIFTSSDSIIYFLEKPMDEGSRGIFICKYDRNGRILKLKFYSEGKSETPGDMVLTKNGDLIIGGVIFYREGNELKRNFLLLRFDKDLNLLWKRVGDEMGRSQITAVCLDRFENIYVTGGFISHMRICGKEVDHEDQDQRIFLARFNANGDLKWFRTEAFKQDVLNFSQVGIDLACDQRGRIYVTGSAASRPFLARLNRRGKLKWHLQCKGLTSYVSELALNENGDVFLSGYGHGSEFPSTDKDTSHYTSKGSTDFYLSEYDKRGRQKFLWAGGGEGTDYASSIEVVDQRMYVLGRNLGGLPVVFDQFSINERFPVIWWGVFNLP